MRVRLTRIDNVDLNLFEFDYDLTFMVFFMNAEGKVYARYGGRDAHDADNRQSLRGLNYTMKSVLAMHRADQPAFAPRTKAEAKTARDSQLGKGRGCMHCHQVREALNARLKKEGAWTRDLVDRFPLPENVGIVLEVDRGNVVKKVVEKSPAAAIGLKPGDVLKQLGQVPQHSFGDAQYALDLAPKAGTLAVTWRRGDQVQEGQLTLAEGWRHSDFSWRPSLRHLVASARLQGVELTAEERKSAGLSPKQLAFFQKDPVPPAAKRAGIEAGDIILGFDGKTLDLNVTDFHYHVRGAYLAGDRVVVNLLRGGKRHDIPMTLGQ